MRLKSKFNFILLIIILSAMIICAVIKQYNLMQLFLGILVAFILSAVLQAKDFKLIEEGKYLKTNSLINITAYLIAIVIILFVVKSLWLFSGFSIYIIVSRHLLYKKMLMLIGEENCGC